MKTKYIFRMLLVAALLMGANNVKAEDNYQYEGEIFANANLTSSSVIRVNCIRTSNDYWQITFTTGASQSPDFNDYNSNSWGGHDWTSSLAYDSNNHRSFLLNDNHFDLKCTSSTVTKLNRDGLKITTQNLTITSLEIDGVPVGGGGGGTSTTDEPAWTGNHYFGSWGGNGGGFLYLPAGTFNDLNCDGNDVIRVYGTLGNLSPDNGVTTYGIEFVTLDWTNFLKFHGTDNFANGYVDIPIIADRISLGSNGGTLLTPEQFASYLKTTNNNGNCALMNGYNFTITSIVVNPSSTTTSYTVTAAATTNGSINYDATNTSHRAGSSYTFSVTPANGYSIGTVSIVDENGDDISSEVHLTRGQTTNGATTYTFVVPEMNVVITATFTEIVTIDATIDATYGAITFSCEVPVVIPSGITAYYAKQVTNSIVELLPVTGIIPAETGVVLFGDAGTYTFTEASSAGQTITGNLLTPVLDERGYICERDNQYVLTWHDRLVFAQTGSENYAYVPYGKAYLDLGSAVSSSRLRISLGNGNESTGIQSLYNDERSLDGIVYNLRGQRVEHPTKGLYIINGKKVMIK